MSFALRAGVPIEQFGETFKGQPCAHHVEPNSYIAAIAIAIQALPHPTLFSTTPRE
jgi:hypothetical protein